MDQRPRIVRSPLTGRWYIATRYIDRGGGKLEVITKYEVTEEIHRIIAVETVRGMATGSIEGNLN